VDPSAIRPPRSTTEVRARIRTSGRQTVATELEPTLAVTPAATAVQSRAPAPGGVGNDPGSLSGSLSDPVGRAALDARAEYDEHGAPRDGSALLRFRAYARRPAGLPPGDPDTDLQL
jgi:hypothetical protein